MTATPNNLGDATLAVQTQPSLPATTMPVGPAEHPPAPTTFPATPQAPPIKRQGPAPLVAPAAQSSVSSTGGTKLTQTVQTQTVNRTSFLVGDTVQSSIDGRIGTIVKPNGLVPQGALMVALPFAILPSPTPAPPLTQRVNVNWLDGTSSVVLLSTLRKAA